MWIITSSRRNAAAQARMKAAANELTKVTSTRKKHERNRVIAETCRHHWMKRPMGLKMKMTSLMIYKVQEIFQTEAQILPCREYRKKKTLKKTLALEEGDVTFDLTPTPILLMNTDTSQEFELPVPFSLLSVHEDIHFLLGTFLTYLLLERIIYNYKGDSVANTTKPHSDKSAIKGINTNQFTTITESRNKCTLCTFKI